MLADMVKYNSATVQGWRVVRVTPQTLKSRETLWLLIDRNLTLRSTPAAGGGTTTVVPATVMGVLNGPGTVTAGPGPRSTAEAWTPIDVTALPVTTWSAEVVVGRFSTASASRPRF